MENAFFFPPATTHKMVLPRSLFELSIINNPWDVNKKPIKLTSCVYFTSLKALESPKKRNVKHGRVKGVSEAPAH